MGHNPFEYDYLSLKLILQSYTQAKVYKFTECINVCEILFGFLVKIKSHRKPLKIPLNPYMFLPIKKKLSA